MIVGGWDPSYTCTGWAFLEAGPAKILLLSSGVITTSPSDEADRLGYIQECASRVVNESNGCGIYGIEQSFLHVGNRKGGAESVKMNIGTSLALREVCGVIHACCARANGLPEVIRVAPASAKSSLCGSGDAKKAEMVARAELTICGFSAATSRMPMYKREAIADACGIALAALKESRNRVLRQNAGRV